MKDITDYGTVTPGGDWTAAIQAMAADARGYQAGYVKLPAGSGIYNGTPLNGGHINIQGAGPMHTALTCQTPLVDAPTVRSFNLEKLGIHGGTNLVTIGAATDCGGRYRTIDLVEFHGFTGTAINITGSDTPYFHISRVTIDGKSGATGISFAGWTDSTVIEHCEFRAYTIGLKLSGSMQRITVRDNNFMHVSDQNTAPRTDIWITPSPSNVSCGYGAAFDNNWHGNEGRATNDNFIAIADGTNTPNLTKASTGYLSGVNIEGSTVFVTGNPPYTPYIFTTTDNLADNNWGQRCRQYGSAPFVKTLSGRALAASNLVSNWGR